MTSMGKFYESAAWRLDSAETVLVTHEVAERMANMAGSPTERDIKPQRIRELEAKVAGGELVTFHWATAQVEGQTEVFRVNGQHSSKVLANLNGGLPEGVVAHIDHYKVPSLQSLGHLFRQFDARISARSAADVSGAIQGLIPELEQVPKAFAKLGIEGLAWYRTEVIGLPAVKNDDRYELMNEPGNWPFLQSLSQVLSEKTPELKNTYVVAAMYGTYDEHPDEAIEFWQSVAKGGESFDEDAPAHVLDQWLRDIKNKPTEQLVKVKPGQIYQGCIYAWNAHRATKKIRAVKTDTSKGFLDID